MLIGLFDIVMSEKYFQLVVMRFYDQFNNISARLG